LSCLADRRVAGQNSQDLVLDVLTVDRRAQALYQRLGVREVARHGEGNIKITKRLRPQRRKDLKHISTDLDYCSQMSCMWYRQRMT